MSFQNNTRPLTASDIGYRPQHTDLEKFGRGLAAAFGKPVENTLVDCEKCGSRHWTHQSCRLNPSNPQTK